MFNLLVFIKQNNKKVPTKILYFFICSHSVGWYLNTIGIVCECLSVKSILS